MSKTTSLDKSKIRILLLEGVHQSAIDTLNAQGYTNIEYHTGSLPEEELIELPHSAYPQGFRSGREAGRRRLLLYRHQPG